jgi:phage tail sheath protein FI
MAAQVSYPGVYIQELASGAHTITGVATSITAFVGYTARGVDHKATRLFSFADYERAFGGLARDSELSYAVNQFFDNGGSDAYVVRVPKNDALSATAALFSAVSGTQDQALVLTAISKGAWANRVVVDVDYAGVSDNSSFNMTITDRSSGQQELFADISADSSATNYCVKVLNDSDNGSTLVRVANPSTDGPKNGARPAETGTAGAKMDLVLGTPSAADYTIKIGADGASALASKPISVTVISTGDQIPATVLGLARQVERKINAELQKVLPGTAIRCVPNSSGNGLRLYADFDPEAVSGEQFDAILSLTDVSANTPLQALGLKDAAANVGHFWLGKGRQVAAQNHAAAARVGVDGSVLPKSEDLIGDEAQFSGIYALDRVDLFNILCIPDATRASPGDPASLDPNVDPNSIYAKALSFIESRNRRAFVLIDAPPNVNDVEKAADWKAGGLTVSNKNAAAYFPRLRLPDALNGYKLRTFAPCGVIAGLYARIDANRGIWKAPAGVEATLNGVQGQVYNLTDIENGVLNKLGLNCLRNFPVYGNVAWGSRTLLGSDEQGSEWKYVPVRRLALNIEESLFRGTKWVVFEPNDEPLWAQIRLNVGAFMHDLYRQGAFQGRTPKEAYLVKCDSETTTQNDIDKGIVNILVAFAPLKPAEFVVIKIQQIAGQIQA